MPLHHAVLARLADGPSYGYELKSSFEHSVGPQWGALNIGHLYQVLDRLQRDGLVTASKVAQSVKPDRVMYEITHPGRTELADWLNSPSPRTSGFRDDFFLKLMAAAHRDDPRTVHVVIANQRSLLLHELHNLAQLRRDHTGDTVVGLLLRAAERHVSADLAFLDDAEESLASQPPAVSRRRPAKDSRGAARDERTA